MILPFPESSLHWCSLTFNAASIHAVDPSQLLSRRSHHAVLALAGQMARQRGAGLLYDLRLSLQELRAHCAMLVRTHNELVEQRNRLLLAAGYATAAAPDAAAAAPAAAVSNAAGAAGCQVHDGGGSKGSDGCSVMPDTPEQEAAAGNASDLPPLQLSNGSFTEVGAHSPFTSCQLLSPVCSCHESISCSRGQVYLNGNQHVVNSMCSTRPKGKVDCFSVRSEGEMGAVCRSRRRASDLSTTAPV